MRRVPSHWVVETAVPRTVRDDYALVAAEHVRAHEPLLYIGFCFGVPCAMLLGDGLPPWLRVGLPSAIFIACIVGAILRGGAPTTAAGATRSLAVSTLVTCSILAAGSLWAVYSWSLASEAARFGYPFFMTLGVLVTGYVFAKVRRLGAVCLAVGLLPIVGALVVAGNTVERICAVGIVVAGIFLCIMAVHDRRLLVELLVNRRRLHDLSRRDSLTGLDNRRALLADADRMGQQAKELRLILIDLDRFKTINDAFGHDIGDCVLQKVARIIREVAPSGTSVARVGGEEFALLGDADRLSAVSAIHLLTLLRESAMPHGERVTASIGISTGSMQSESDWKRLYARADKALYEAKAEGRDRAIPAVDRPVGNGAVEGSAAA